MKTKLAAAALAVLLTGPVAAQESAEGKGVVKAVDVGAHKLNIAHEAIPALHWPAMTMDFRTAPALDLSALKPGAKIRFSLDRDAQGMVLVKSIQAE